MNIINCINSYLQISVDFKYRLIEGNKYSSTQLFDWDTCRERILNYRCLNDDNYGIDIYSFFSDYKVSILPNCYGRYLIF